MSGLATGADWVLDALDVIYAEGPSMDAIQQAQASVIRALENAGANIIYYDVMPNTPLGPIYVAVDKGGLLAVDCYAGQIGQWQDGVFEVIDPGENRTADPIYPKPGWPPPPG